MRRDSNKRIIRWWLHLTSSLVTLALCASLLPACGAESPGSPPEALVIKVIDGDTLELEGGARVRVLGIDAPEMGKDGQPPEFLAHQSKKLLADLTLQKKILLEYDRQHYDHYGRLLAYLFLPDRTFVNAEMVRQGLARVYLHPPNERYWELLLAAQREAMGAKRGIWQKLTKQDEPYYLGNRNTLRLHRPGCPLAAKMAPAHRVRLDSREDAYLQGYSPCRSCRP